MSIRDHIDCDAVKIAADARQLYIDSKTLIEFEAGAIRNLGLSSREAVLLWEAFDVAADLGVEE